MDSSGGTRRNGSTETAWSRVRQEQTENTSKPTFLSVEIDLDGGVSTGVEDLIDGSVKNSGEGYRWILPGGRGSL